MFKSLNPYVIKPFCPDKLIVHEKHTEIPIKNIYAYNVLIYSV